MTFASDHDIANEQNERDRHCRVRVKHLKVPSVRPGPYIPGEFIEASPARPDWMNDIFNNTGRNPRFGYPVSTC